MNIKSFCEVTWDDFQNNIFKAIDKEIDNCKDDYILNVCAEDYITYLVDKYTLECKKRRRLLQQNRSCCYSSEVAKLMFFS